MQWTFSFSDISLVERCQAIFEVILRQNPNVRYLLKPLFTKWADFRYASVHTLTLSPLRNCHIKYLTPPASRVTIMGWIYTPGEIGKMAGAVESKRSFTSSKKSIRSSFQHNMFLETKKMSHQSAQKHKAIHQRTWLGFKVSQKALQLCSFTSQPSVFSCMHFQEWQAHMTVITSWEKASILIWFQTLRLFGRMEPISGLDKSKTIFCNVLEYWSS